MQFVKCSIPVIVLLMSASIGLHSKPRCPLVSFWADPTTSVKLVANTSRAPRCSTQTSSPLTHIRSIPSVCGKRPRSNFSEFNYVHIRQADNNAEDPARQARNLNFRNRMVEFGFRTDFTVFHISDRSKNRNFARPGKLSVRGFVFTGAYGVLHNPSSTNHLRPQQ